MERADSIGLDAHNWFFQPYEAGCLLVKNATTLDTAFRIPHDMLQDTIWGAKHPNFSDRGLQLSRSVPGFENLDFRADLRDGRLPPSRGAKAMELASRAQEYIEAEPGSGGS